MATNTPNYDWPIPEDSDLVKDGAKAIRDLGNAIDTSAEDFGGGLIHINTTSFSAVASQSINDVFSATYDNYLILGTLVGSGGAVDVNLRLRVSGTDASGSNYNSQIFLASGATLTGSQSLSATSINVAAATSSDYGQFKTNIFFPFAAQPTLLETVRGFASASNIPNMKSVLGGHNVSTSYTGFTIIPTSTNITGAISVYGYRKS
jgi:hypothetical protein